MNVMLIFLSIIAGAIITQTTFILFGYQDPKQKQKRHVRQVRRRLIKVIKNTDRFAIVTIDGQRQNPDDPKKFHLDTSLYPFNLEGNMLAGALISCAQSVQIASSGHLDNVNDAMGDAGISKN